MSHNKQPRLTPAALAALANGDMANFVVAATPGSIEAQEAAGQAELVRSEMLPRDLRYLKRADLERIGFVFGRDVDKLFVNAKLPRGWTKRASAHSMWSYLDDDKGRVRASIFYKAAFYDRSAFMTMRCRYGVNSYLPCDKDGNLIDTRVTPGNTHWKTVVTDADKPIEAFGVREDRDYHAQDIHERAARRWVSERFPDWDNATAYW